MSDGSDSETDTDKTLEDYNNGASVFMYRYAEAEFAGIKRAKNGEIVAITRHIYFDNVRYERTEKQLAKFIKSEGQLLQLFEYASDVPSRLAPTHMTKKQRREENKFVEMYFLARARQKNAAECLVAVQAEKHRLGIPLDTEPYSDSLRAEMENRASVTNINEFNL